MFALTSITGIGRRFANIVCKKADVDMNIVCKTVSVSKKRQAFYELFIRRCHVSVLKLET
ncbi:40S ribosomal protein S18 [Platanthera guangdongensis]|uniref:40S ribosomal protein S18 n=1 Tax=Platanthera guangdongensis TaxID=2320717 RepID=A0ABR2M988_9ASPA